MSDLWAYALIQLGVVVFCAVGTFIALRLVGYGRDKERP